MSNSELPNCVAEVMRIAQEREDERELQRQRVTCSGCGAEFESVMRRCASCSRWFCVNCLDECDMCKEAFCAECQSRDPDYRLDDNHICPACNYEMEEAMKERWPDGKEPEEERKSGTESGNN